jgi:hypothetical protein
LGRPPSNHPLEFLTIPWRVEMAICRPDHIAEAIQYRSLDRN